MCALNLQVANGKPAPDVFSTAAQQLGVPASSCLAFEDAPSGVEVRDHRTTHMASVAHTNMLLVAGC